MKTVGKQLVGVTANEHLVEIEKGQLGYDIVHLDISENAESDIGEDREVTIISAGTATITILLNNDDLESSVYSPNSDVKPISVQKISKDELK